MSHHIYKTEGVILRSFDFRESNKIFFVITKDLGSMYANAQGIRENKSKLRGHLQDFNLLQIDLVKGREFWKIINVQEIEGFSLLEKEKLIVLTRIFSLLKRLLQGEEKNTLLFKELTQILFFLKYNDLNKTELSNLEIIANLKTLYHLGYGTDIDKLQKFISEDISRVLLDEFVQMQSVAVTELNELIKGTQL